MAWVGPQLVGVGVSGNHQGGANNVNQVDRESDIVLTCAIRGGLSRGSMASASISVQEKTASLASPQSQTFQFLPSPGTFQAAAPVLEL